MPFSRSARASSLSARPCTTLAAEISEAGSKVATVTSVMFVASTDLRQAAFERGNTACCKIEHRGPLHGGLRALNIDLLTRDRRLRTVDLDFGIAFDFHLRAFDFDLLRAADRQLHARDLDRAVLLHHDLRLTDLERDLVSRFEGVLLLDVRDVVLLDRRRATLLDRARLVLLDGRLQIAPDSQFVVVVDRGRTIALVFLLRADCDRLIVLDDDLHVFLGVDVDRFLVLLVVEADLVEILRGALFRAARLDAALCLLRRQLVRRQLVGVVHAADDQRMIGVAIEERDDDLLADARHELHSPVLTRPDLRDAHPARAIAIGLAGTVPMKLYLHAAVLIGIDLLPLSTNDQRRLRALNQRLRREARWTIRLTRIDRLDVHRELHGSVASGTALHLIGQHLA